MRSRLARGWIHDTWTDAYVGAQNAAVRCAGRAITKSQLVGIRRSSAGFDRGRCESVDLVYRGCVDRPCRASDKLDQAADQFVAALSRPLLRGPLPGGTPRLVRDTPLDPGHAYRHAWTTATCAVCWPSWVSRLHGPRTRTPPGIRFGCISLSGVDRSLRRRVGNRPRNS